MLSVTTEWLSTAENRWTNKEKAIPWNRFCIKSLFLFHSILDPFVLLLSCCLSFKTTEIIGKCNGTITLSFCKWHPSAVQSDWTGRNIRYIIGINWFQGRVLGGALSGKHPFLLTDAPIIASLYKSDHYLVLSQEDLEGPELSFWPSI